MPHDATPRPERDAVIFNDAVLALREALGRRLAGDSTDGDVRQALRRLSHEARANGLHGEQVVIVLKQMWNELAGRSETLAADERRQTLERLVTLCIEEYYAGQ